MIFLVDYKISAVMRAIYLYTVNHANTNSLLMPSIEANYDNHDDD